MRQYNTKTNLYDFYRMFDQDILVSYKGPFDKHILAVIGNYIEVIIKGNPNVSRKIFKIFIELAQNIAFYSSEITKGDKPIGIGTLVVGQYEDFYTFSTGNVVKKDMLIPMIEKFEIINTLDREDLRAFKRKQRGLPQGEYGGANIGLIQVALTASAPIEYEVTEVDDHTAFLSLSVKVKS